MESVDPRSECLDPVKGGGLPPPYPPPLDPFVDPSVQNPGGQPSKCEPQPPGRPRPAKTTYPNTVLPEGHFGTPLRFLVLGFEVLELPPGTCETGLHTSGAGVRTCGAAPSGVPKAPHGSECRTNVALMSR